MGTRLIDGSASFSGGVDSVKAVVALQQLAVLRGQVPRHRQMVVLTQVKAAAVVGK